MRLDKNYYEILGIEEAADIKDVRKAYRALTKKHHPDVNQHDSEAEEKFKEINEAHEILSDPEKRGRYDNLRKGNVNFNGALDFGSRGQVHNSDLGCDAWVTLEETLKTYTLYAKYNYKVSCATCSGVGGTGSMKVCPVCNGNRTIRQTIQTPILQIMGMDTPCPHCKMIGAIFENPCVSCQGQGITSELGVVSIPMRPGLAGNRFMAAGMGNFEFPDKPRGNLFVNIRITPHERFRLSNLPHVVCQVDIDPVESILGGTVKVVGIDGENLYKEFSPGIHEGQQLEFPEKGIYYNASQRASLIAIVGFKTSENITDEQKELLTKYLELRETA